ncbi:MAG: hypothetical protein KTR31_26715 [Myxococcales bacterium]|nr:hypothetical protein [Myxococcales bacterium]
MNNASRLEVRLLAALSLASCAVESEIGSTADGAVSDVAVGTLTCLTNPTELGLVEVELTDLPPSEVYLLASMQEGRSSVAGIHSDLDDPVVMAHVEAGAESLAVVEGAHGLWASAGERVSLQAVSADGSWRTAVVSLPVVPFEPVCGDAVRAERFEEDWQPGLNVVACDPTMLSGFCEPANRVDGGALLAQTIAVRPAGFFLGDACLEEGAIAACCYSFELVDRPRNNNNNTNNNGGGTDWGAGRPFRVQGESRQSTVAARGAVDRSIQCSEDLRGAVVESWLGSAVEEHASVAAFARFTLELMQLGAPASMVRDATRAQLDEVHHTQLALDVASRVSGASYDTTPLPMEGALDGRDLRSVTLDVVREGCINETVSALLAMEARDAAVHAPICSALATVADDEARHAELAWRFVRWALERDPTLRSEVLQILESFDVGDTPASDPRADALAAYGVLAACRRHRVAVRAQQVIARCTASLS